MTPGLENGKRVYQLLVSALKWWGDAIVQVTSLDTTPIRVTIISDRFQGRTLRERQEMIAQALAEFSPNEDLSALASINTFTYIEW